MPSLFLWIRLQQKTTLLKVINTSYQRPCSLLKSSNYYLPRVKLKKTCALSGKSSLKTLTAIKKKQRPILITWQRWIQSNDRVFAWTKTKGEHSEEVWVEGAALAWRKGEGEPEEGQPGEGERKASTPHTLLPTQIPPSPCPFNACHAG